MEFIKKLLVLSVMPVSVLAIGESEEVRKPVNHKDMEIRSFYNDSQYRKKIFKEFKTAKKGYKKNILDVTNMESTIIEQVRKPYERKIDILSKEFNETLNKNAELYKQINRLKNPVYSRSRFFGLGTLTGVLLTGAYIGCNSIISYYKNY